MSRLRYLKKKNLEKAGGSWAQEAPKKRLQPAPFKVHNPCVVTSPPLVSSPLPPTGHPEACWNTMPVLAQAPTSGPNAEVTSSGKNGIVSLERHNTLQTLGRSEVLCSMGGLEKQRYQLESHMKMQQVSSY